MRPVGGRLAHDRCRHGQVIVDRRLCGHEILFSDDEAVLECAPRSVGANGQVDGTDEFATLVRSHADFTFALDTANYLLGLVLHSVYLSLDRLATASGIDGPVTLVDVRLSLCLDQLLECANAKADA